MPWFQRSSLALMLCTVAVLVAPVECAHAADDPAMALYYSANALYNRKLYALAAGEFQTFLQRHPEHAKVKDAEYGLALSYYSAERFAESEPLLRKVAVYGNVGDVQQLQGLLGQCLLQLNRPAEAQQAFEALLAAQPKAPLGAVALAGLCESIFKQKKWKETMDAADRLVQAEGADAYRSRGLYQGAYARHQLDQYKEAIPLLERLLAMEGADPLKPQASFILAECYRETGALDKAAEQYTASAGLQGSAHEVAYRLGFVRFLQKQYDPALKAFETCLQEQPDGPFAGSARVFIGRAWLEKKDFVKAAEQFQPLLAADAGANADEASLWLARTFMLQKDTAKAAEILKAALQRSPASALLRELQFDYANCLVAAGTFDEAGKLLAGAVNDPKWSQKNDAIRLYAVCLHRVGDYAGSLAQAESFLKAFPGDAHAGDIRFLQAENLFLLDRMDAAATAYAEFVKADPKHTGIAAANLRLAQIHHRKGQWDEALKLALPLAPETAGAAMSDDLTFLIGDSRFRLEQWRAALTTLDAFVKQCSPKDPRLGTALVELGIAAIRNHNVAAAAAPLERLVKELPDSPHRPVALAELGRMHYEAGRHAEARAALEECAKLAPNGPQRPKAEYYLGWVSTAEKKADEAMRHFETIITATPKDPLAIDAALQLGLLQLAAGKFPEASRTLAAFLQQNPKHAEAEAATYALGVAKARTRDWPGAIAEFSRLLEAQPDSMYADRSLYEWAWCEKELKKPDEAVKRYEQLLAKYPASELATKVQTELAELTFDAKDYGKVIAQLEQALVGLKDAKLREQTLYRLGTAYFNKGDHAKAAKTFEEVIAQYPKSDLVVSARFQAGESRLKLQETVAARDHFRAVVDAKPEPAVLESALLRLGETQELTKQWPEAAATYQAFTAAFPTSKWARRAAFGNALALENQGKPAEALVAYRAFVADGQKDELAARAQFQVGECLFSLKQYDEAVKELVRVTVSYGQKQWTAKSLLEMGRVLEAKGDVKQAMVQFREVIDKYPADDVAVVARQRLDALRRAP